MSEPQRCPKCGADIPEGTPEGLCPRCLLQAGMESQPGTPEQPAEAPTLPPRPPTLSPPTAAFSPPGGFVPPTPEELGRQFPHLEILELAGQGGMGAVYKARQPNLDRLVALKILPPHVAADPAFAERFKREAQALAKLNHPNIVAVYDFGQTRGEGQPRDEGREERVEESLAPHPSALAPRPSPLAPLFFFLMEYVDGVSLRQAMRQGKLQPAEALKIVPQICDALQFAHDEGIVHRDIKPENILLDKRGRVKIADFGLAKLLGVKADHTLTGSRQMMGTPHYMAPEHIMGSRTVDHRADIYSLGVTFYEMLTGELPLGRFAPPSKKVQIDVRLDEVVLRTLEVEPEQRYQHASELKTEVEEISNGPASARVPRKGFSSRHALEQTIADLLPEDKPRAIAFYRKATGAGLEEAISAVKAIAVKFSKDKPVAFAMDSLIWSLVWAMAAVLGGFWLAQTQSNTANKLMFRFGGIVLGAFWIAHNVAWQRRRSGWHLEDLEEEEEEQEEQEEEVEDGAEQKKPEVNKRNPERTRSQLQRTAEGLWLWGALCVVTGVGVWIWLAAAQARGGVARGGVHEAQLVFELFAMGFTHVVCGVVFLGAGMLIRMQRLRMPALVFVVLFGLFAPAVVILNVVMEFNRISPTWPVMFPLWLGMPLAAWTSYLLFRDDVRQLFQSQPPVATTTKLRIATWFLAIVFIVCAVISCLHETSGSHVDGVTTYDRRVIGYLDDPWLRITGLGTNQEEWEIRWASWGMAILALGLVSLAALLWIHLERRMIIWLLVIGLIVAVLALVGFVLFSSSENQGVSQPAVGPKH